MWYNFLQNNYSSRAEWIAFSNTFGLASRLGFRSAAEAWDANPFIQGSVNPADFGLSELKPVAGLYVDGDCPDCNEKIPENATAGDECEVCGHVFSDEVQY